MDPPSYLEILKPITKKEEYFRYFIECNIKDPYAEKLGFFSDYKFLYFKYGKRILPDYSDFIQKAKDVGLTYEEMYFYYFFDIFIKTVFHKSLTVIKTCIDKKNLTPYIDKFNVDPFNHEDMCCLSTYFYIKIIKFSVEKLLLTDKWKTVITDSRGLKYISKILGWELEHGKTFNYFDYGDPIEKYVLERNLHRYKEYIQEQQKTIRKLNTKIKYASENTKEILEQKSKCTNCNKTKKNILCIDCDNTLVSCVDCLEKTQCKNHTTIKIFFS